ncbi:MAG: hypothetical protein ACI9J3_003089 [Parvicellaceae bacterium]|jgi:hypothetical protein
MKLLICSILMILSSTSFSQGLFEYFKLTADDDGPEKFDRIAVDINWDSWLGAPVDIKTGNYSIGVNAYWYKDIPLNKKSTIAFAFGLGFGSHNVHHNGQLLNLDSAGNNFTGLYPLSQGTAWKKNKFTANYFDIPIELRFRNMYIQPKNEGANFKKIRIYPGFKFGVMVNNHTKWRDDNIKYKVYNLKNVLKYRYGATVRVAFNKIAFSAFYSLSPLFEKGKGQEMYPISIGVSWIRF